jgi:Domain of unknown function (DUF1840)
MLIRFSSVAAEPITMFGDSALILIRMLGASGAVPGAIGSADIPAALARLREHLQIHEVANPAPAKAEKNEEGDDKDREPPIALAVRAAPLIEMLARAVAADEPLMWEQV